MTQRYVTGTPDCNTCSALIANKDQHNDWHLYLAGFVSISAAVL